MAKIPDANGVDHTGDAHAAILAAVREESNTDSRLPRGLLTPTRCRALATISRRGPSTSAELAEAFGVRSKAALTRTLRTLVSHGLLQSEQLEAGWYGERRYSLTPTANRIGYRYRPGAEVKP